MRADVVDRPELGVDARQHRRPEDAADDARDLERAPRSLGERVDAAEDQAVQALGQLERAERAARRDRSTSCSSHVVQELLDVERVPLRAARRRGRGGLAAPRCRSPTSCASLAAHDLGHLGLARAPSSAHLLERRAARRGRAVRQRRLGAVREDEQQMRAGSTARASTSSRSRESGSSQWQSSSTSTRGVGARERAQAVDQQVLERGLAQLGVERRRQLGVRDRQAEHGVEQRRARDERRIDVRRAPARAPATCSASGSVSGSREQRRARSRARRHSSCVVPND